MYPSISEGTLEIVANLATKWMVFHSQKADLLGHKMYGMLSGGRVWVGVATLWCSNTWRGADVREVARRD